METKISNEEQNGNLQQGAVRCSACVFYQERGKSTGICNKHLKTFYHSKTGKWAMSMNINVRSFWKCDDFLHCT